MKKLISISLLLIALSLIPKIVLSQFDEYSSELIGIPKFYFEAISLESGEAGVSRLDVYIEVPYEALHFTKAGEFFNSKYEVSINIYDSVETLVSEKWWVEEVETKDYTQSVSSAMSKTSYRSFMLTPGKYFIAVQIKDSETEKITRSKRKVNIRNYFTPKFSISDILLVNRLEKDSGKTVVYPNIGGSVGSGHDSFYVFFDVYNAIAAESADVFINIHNVKGDIIKKDTFKQILQVPKKSCFYQVTTSQFISGDYIIDVNVIPRSLKDGITLDEISTKTSRSFVIHWRGLPVSITNLDEAIDQLQYIIDRDKLEEIRKAPPEKKREMFRDFWKKKDPSPNTEKNELMDEYYSRIQYANKNFGHYIDGWKTDMGMIYVIFGPPSNIERHPFELDSKPYEVWSYYDLNREFVFVDMNGFGDYRLQTPLWDVNRSRIR